MTTETDTQNSSLQGAFGDRGTNVNNITYGHPHGEAILNGCKEILLESETGQILVRILNHHQIPVHIMKGTGESGFSPELKTIYLQIPGKITKATGEVVIQLAKAIREADQEYAGMTAPDPMKDVVAYAGFMHARNVDSIYYVFQTIKELKNSSFFDILLDTLKNLGLNDMYKAYLEGKSKEELYDYYADAYEMREGI